MRRCAGGGERQREIIVRIFGDVTGAAVAYFQQNDGLRRTVDDLMGVAVASAKSSACPWSKKEFSRICDQRWLAVQDEHELILLGVVMPQGSCGARLQSGPVNAEVLQTKRVAKWTFEPPRDHASEGLRVDVLSSAWRRFGGHDERSIKRILHGPEFTSSRDQVQHLRYDKAALHGLRERAASVP
jgi:hypothetical protein